MPRTLTHPYAVSDEMVYIEEGGATYCGAHLGYTARTTGFDLHGQRIMAVTPDIARLAVQENGYLPTCEVCGKPARTEDAA